MGALQYNISICVSVEDHHDQSFRLDNPYKPGLTSSLLFQCNHIVFPAHWNKRLGHRSWNVLIGYTLDILSNTPTY
jgi:hypothetical protein